MISGFDSTAGGTKTVTVTYEGKTATFMVIVEATLASIAVTGPTKTNYAIGEALDLTGIELTAAYSDGSSEIIPVTADMISGFDSVAAGQKTVTVTYQGKTDVFMVTVEDRGGTIDAIIY
jgi:hypothetical protein